MDALDILNMTFDRAESLVGDYYLVEINGDKMIYDRYKLKLSSLIVIDTNKIREDMCIVEVAYKNRPVYGWMLVLYSNGSRIFSERVLRPILKYGDFDVFGSAPAGYSSMNRCVVFNPITNKKLLDNAVWSVSINDRDILEIELRNRHEIIQIDKKGNKEIIPY